MRLQRCSFGYLLKIGHTVNPSSGGIQKHIDVKKRWSPAVAFEEFNYSNETSRPNGILTFCKDLQHLIGRVRMQNLSQNNKVIIATPVHIKHIAFYEFVALL